MDEGPFRASRPADRRVSRPEPAQRQPEPIYEESKTANRAPAPNKAKKKSSKRPLLWVITIVLAVLVAIVGWVVVSNSTSGVTGIDKSKYQAVFFTNGQVYFGKLDTLNSDYLKMTDIYYLQTQSTEETDSENPQETSSDQSNVQLIKLGEEIHGPEDSMVISRDQVLFYENIKNDGKVAQSIEAYKKSH